VEVEPEMKTQRLAAGLAMLAMTAMAAASLCAGQSAVPQKATVTVCMESDPYTLEGVRPLTAAAFARIGVGIAWHTLDDCPLGVDAIQVRLSHDPAGVRNASTQALAAAQPSARTIIVFLDRVKELSRNRGISLMPNVLIHEITHILEGINRHSATGVMKARWDEKDYFAMRCQPLDFAPQDVTLIYDGLKIPRSTEAAVAAQ
jgi:hypothetical protein